MVLSVLKRKCGCNCSRSACNLAWSRRAWSCSLSRVASEKRRERRSCQWVAYVATAPAHASRRIFAPSSRSDTAPVLLADTGLTTVVRRPLRRNALIRSAYSTTTSAETHADFRVVDATGSAARMTKYAATIGALSARSGEYATTVGGDQRRHRRDVHDRIGD
jgi:hypothetical protein